MSTVNPQASPTLVRRLNLSVRGSHPGRPSALPALTPLRPAGTTRVGDGAPPDMLERVARGVLTSPLPYGIVSDYDREDRDLQLPALELDNGLVRAVVLPTLGGRVWSLEDRVGGRELLFRNPRLRWANFGLTDAWFAGGIEWNLGSTGHTTTSNQPFHAAVLQTPVGPVVRLWEWERTRDLVLQVDLWLDGSRLMASTRVTNPDPEPKPLYYWTNIAVPETAGTRVLVPATHAWRTDYSGALTRVAVPFPDGPTDVSLAAASDYPADYFYEVADQRGAMVCAVEPDGLGMSQTSTAALRGRKLFLWGQSPGGERWQEWLSGPDTRYLEIQAGVCPTQMEHDLLDGSASLAWTEAFSALDLDPALAAGDHDTAASAARDAVHVVAPPDWLDQQHARWLAEVADLDPGDPSEFAQTGSGWGRAELALRGQQDPPGVAFPEVADQSAPLARFAASGDPAELDAVPDADPTLPLVSTRWRERLGSIEAPNWWVHYALATAHHLTGDLEAARTAYGLSVGLQPTGVALRGLALLNSDPEERAALYARATELAPGERRLAVERLASLRDTGRYADLVAVAATLPEPVRRHGRTRLLVAEAHAALGEEEAALAIFADLEVPDLAEGDRTLSDAWERLRPDEAVPPHLDFRMSQAARD